MRQHEVITKTNRVKKAHHILHEYLAHHNLLDVSDILQDAHCAWSRERNGELNEAVDKDDFKIIQGSLWEEEDVLTDLIEFINALRTVQLLKA